METDDVKGIEETKESIMNLENIKTGDEIIPDNNQITQDDVNSYVNAYKNRINRFYDAAYNALNEK